MLYDYYRVTTYKAVIDEHIWRHHITLSLFSRMAKIEDELPLEKDQTQQKVRLVAQSEDISLKPQRKPGRDITGYYESAHW